MKYGRTLSVPAILCALLYTGCGSEAEGSAGDDDVSPSDEGAPVDRDEHVDEQENLPEKPDEKPEEQPRPGEAVTKVRVSPTSGLSTREGGETAAFTVELTSAPRDTVSIRVFSSDDGEGTVSTSEILFTPDDWQARTVIVTGMDDAETDGNQRYEVVLDEAVSADERYQGANVQDVTLLNIDDDEPGLTVTHDADIHTSESGDVASIVVRLNTQPSHKVLIPVSMTASDEAELQTILLSFYPRDWNVAQTITVKGLDDLLEDGHQSLTVTMGKAESEDAAYLGRDPGSVTFLNLDDEADEVFVKPLLTTLAETDTATHDLFDLRLRSKPTSNVTVKVVRAANARDSESRVGSYVFTPDDWHQTKRVSHHFFDDEYAFGDRQVEYRFTVETTDEDYRDLMVPSQFVTLEDDERAGLNVTHWLGTVCEGSEDDCCAMMGVYLTSHPYGGTTVELSVSDASEARLDETTIYFEGYQDAYEYFVVCGVNDDVVDGDVSFTVNAKVTSSADPVYTTVEPASLTLTNLDDD